MGTGYGVPFSPFTRHSDFTLPSSFIMHTILAGKKTGGAGRLSVNTSLYLAFK
jgi:hypothetical protein